MKTVVLAYHNIGCVGIRALIDQGFDIQAIFSHKDDSKENIWFESVADVAANNDIPVYTPSDINHPIWVDRIKEMAPEIIFSFYYRDMVKKEIIDIPSVGCFNLHGSLLPSYRGRCPVNWVLINGEKETGVTLHKMTPKPDDGGILGHEYVTIDDDDTALILHKKLAYASGVLLKKLLPWIKKNRINPVAQNQSEASYFGGRKPDDGKIDWNQSASVIYNLVRAVTRPYPGAFSFLGNTRCIFWEVKVTEALQQAIPGTILSTNPLTIACKDKALEVLFGQTTEGVYVNGNQLVREMNLTDGMCCSNQKEIVLRRQEKKRVLILGANGFIGNHLSKRLLESGHYEVYGMDLHSNTLEHLKDHPDFYFKEGDISIMHEWIKYHVEKCDVILPLVAIATPKEYVRNPLRVFELDFEENLRIVRYCAKYGKRLIFPSTSEVYGMCQDDEFDEEDSNFIQGPIHKQRWIYSCSKQMLDRVIWAYGATRGLEFTLIRPFNWVGPKLDTLDSARIGSSRVITQFILNLVEGTPIQLVDGGKQKRCFTDVKDGVECLFKIIENKNNCCNSKIFNIGNPGNEYSMEELAEILREQFANHSLRSHFPPDAGVKSIEAKTYYGSGYQDVQHRRPSIKQARSLLDWNPNVPFEQSVGETLDYFLQDLIKNQENNQERKLWQMLDCA